MDQFKLTLYIGGSIEGLPDRLVEVTEVVITSPITTYWDSGIAGASVSAEGMRVELVLNPVGVLLALDAIEGWLRQSEHSTVMAEMIPTFARSIDLDS